MHMIMQECLDGRGKAVLQLKKMSRRGNDCFVWSASCSCGCQCP